jgi:hypothetical protein
VQQQDCFYCDGQCAKKKVVAMFNREANSRLEVVDIFLLGHDPPRHLSISSYQDPVKRDIHGEKQFVMAYTYSVTSFWE